MMLQERNIIISSITKYIKENILISLIDYKIDIGSEDFSLSPPKQESFGDLSSNIALLISKQIQKNPLEIAEEIKKTMLHQNLNDIEGITATKPGFINFVIKPSYYQNNLKLIIKNQENFGKNFKGKGKSANVEFVSANPTGPLTVGHGRNAVIGDTVSNILEWHDYNVTREYYYNDAGKQMRTLGQSVESRYFEYVKKPFEFPSDGYQGEYIIEIAKNIANNYGKSLEQNDEKFLTEAEKVIFGQIKNSLNSLGIKFDTFTNEKSFYKSGAIKKLLSQLKSKELVYQKDDATWYKATKVGAKQDKVYIKSTGEPTYRLPDTAYHKDKIKRGYDVIVDVFGADHTDTYPDVLSALGALGLKTEHIKILIYQFVTLVKNGEKVKMSTRKADFITLDDLVDELSVDIVRYFFIMRSMNTHLDFDLNLAKDQSDKNPVFYLQYAYARICNIIRYGENQGFKFSEKFDPTLLNESSEIKLLKLMSNFPTMMETALETLEPQTIAIYLQDLASSFHKFYGNCKVITNDEKLSQSRLGLINGAKIIISIGLSILGVSAPEKM
ncbi:arginine--tRNA ligase [bacterium]|jgi:arginyl-tRNA synthetase|nr:arginine--tRNA ligase [bacterium]MBT4250074.1 arginine--tRNA ligase [bacterium]MBT6019304.1 arginine--tRNA ligase [bacterium]